MSIRSIEARFELVTPAFASGARPEQTAELRAEAIVGQLRRWWWAQAPLAFSAGERFEHGKAEAFADVLFGSAGSDDASAGKGQGAFLIALGESRVAPDNPSRLRDLFGPLWKDRPKWLWSASANIQPTFTVSFLLRPAKARSPEQDAALVDGLRRAIVLWGLLGGLGAGQRRGFGSVQLIEVRMEGQGGVAWQAPGSAKDFAAKVASELPAAVGSCGVPQGFGSFAANGTPPASVWIAELPNAQDGIAGLEHIQTQLKALQSSLGAGAAANRALDLLSDQTDPRHRRPSPFHFHIARIGASMAVVLSVLPRQGGYPQDRTDWIVGQNNGGVPSLVQRLNMSKILPA